MSRIRPVTTFDLQIAVLRVQEPPAPVSIEYSIGLSGVATVG